jgi:hypothetical protein
MLTCSSHISCEAIWVRFSRRGVRAAEKISEVGFLYEDPGRPAQLHTNHKPAFRSAQRYRIRIVFDFGVILKVNRQVRLPAGRVTGPGGGGVPHSKL